MIEERDMAENGKVEHTHDAAANAAAHNHTIHKAAITAAIFFNYIMSAAAETSGSDNSSKSMSHQDWWVTVIEIILLALMTRLGKKTHEKARDIRRKVKHFFTGGVHEFSKAGRVIFEQAFKEKSDLVEKNFEIARRKDSKDSTGAMDLDADVSYFRDPNNSELISILDSDNEHEPGLKQVCLKIKEVNKLITEGITKFTWITDDEIEMLSTYGIKIESYQDRVLGNFIEKYGERMRAINLPHALEGDREKLDRILNIESTILDDMRIFSDVMVEEGKAIDEEIAIIESLKPKAINEKIAKGGAAGLLIWKDGQIDLLRERTITIGRMFEKEFDILKRMLNEDNIVKRIEHVMGSYGEGMSKEEFKKKRLRLLIKKASEKLVIGGAIQDVSDLSQLVSALDDNVISDGALMSYSDDIIRWIDQKLMMHDLAGQLRGITKRKAMIEIILEYAGTNVDKIERNRLERKA